MEQKNGPVRPLTVSDLAERYGKSVATIYRLNTTKPEALPPHFKIGNAIRWRLDVVEAWELEQTRKDDDA